MAGLLNELFEAVRNYKMPPPAVKILKQCPPLIISAITAGGKTTIAGRIVSQSDYRHVVTHTTRSIRPGEVNGLNYWFVSDSDMLHLINSGAFIETKAVHGNNVYGTSMEAYQSVVSQGYKPLLVMDIQGIQEIIKNIPGTLAFFILPPDYETWMKRLDSRGKMDYSEKTRRLQSARTEIEAVLADDHFRLIVNHDIKSAIREILDSPSTASQQANREIAKKLVNNIKL